MTDDISSVWGFTLNDNVDSGTSKIYVETGTSVTSATVNFCVKFVSSTTGGTLEVNYRELAIELTITLDGTFAVTNMFTAEPNTLASEADSLTYTVTAATCDAVVAFKAGDEISMCVCTSDYPTVRLTGFDTLTYTASDGDAQTAVLAGGTIQPLSSVEGCYVHETLANTYCCQVNTMLAAGFYDGLGTTQDTVTVAGWVEMQLGRRSLQEEGGDIVQYEPQRRRVLVTAEEASFETQVYLEAGESSGSIEIAAGAFGPLMAAVAMVL